MVAAKKKTKNFLENLKEGTLHTALGYKPNEDIPPSKINTIMNKEVGDTMKGKGGKDVKISSGLKKKANFAKNASTWSKGKSKK